MKVRILWNGGEMPWFVVDADGSSGRISPPFSSQSEAFDWCHDNGHAMITAMKSYPINGF